MAPRRGRVLGLAGGGRFVDRGLSRPPPALRWPPRGLPPPPRCVLAGCPAGVRPLWRAADLGPPPPD
eukprot:12764257-Alexandrium_andersonii.AAC.1